MVGKSVEGEAPGPIPDIESEPQNSTYEPTHEEVATFLSYAVQHIYQPKSLK
jgi:hypothetical protein